MKNHFGGYRGGTSIDIKGTMKTFHVFMWKGKWKLLEAVLKFLLIYIVMQLPQCVFWMNCLAEFLMQVSFLLSQFDKRAFVGSLINRDQHPPKQWCKYSFKGLSCQVQGEEFVLRSEQKKEESWSAVDVICLSALHHLHSLTFSSIPWLPRNLEFVIVTPWFYRWKCWVPYSYHLLWYHKQRHV